MFCQKCGKSFENDTGVCPDCNFANRADAQPIPPPPQPQVQPYSPYAQPYAPYGGPQPIVINSQAQPQGNGMATAGLVFGILGFIFSFLFILQVLGFIFSIIGIVKANKLNGQGRGMAITGLIFSILNVVIGIILITTVFGAIIGIGSSAAFAI